MLAWPARRAYNRSVGICPPNVSFAGGWPVERIMRAVALLIVALGCLATLPVSALAAGDVPDFWTA